jgi:hypothetical protein
LIIDATGVVKFEKFHKILKKFEKGSMVVYITRALITTPRKKEFGISIKLKRAEGLTH